MKTSGHRFTRLLAILAALSLLCLTASPAFAFDVSWKNIKSEDLKDFDLVNTIEKLQKYDRLSGQGDHGDSDPNPDADAREAAINSVLRNIRTDFSDVRLVDGYYYRNRINNATQITKEQVQSNILITEQIRASESDFYTRSRTIPVLPATGADGNNRMIYPGNILRVGGNRDEIAKGEYTNLGLGRASGSFKLLKGKEKTFTVDKMKYDPSESDERKQPYYKIETQMYNALDEIRNGESLYAPYIVRTATASSPEQLVAALRITEGELDQAVTTAQWDLIRTGQLQMVLVSVEQIICSVSFTNDVGNNPAAALFSADTTVSDAEAFKNTGGMFIQKVNYGRRYLMTVSLNLGCTPHEERVDLKGAIDTIFTGNSVTSEGMENALTYARYDAYEIGRHSTDWENVLQQKEFQKGAQKAQKLTLSDFITYLSRCKAYGTDIDDDGTEIPMQFLVPTSYEAIALGGLMDDHICLHVDASQYIYIGKKGEQITGMTFADDCLGDNHSRSLYAYGVDIDKFNNPENNGAIVEKKYTIASGDKRNFGIPAYQTVFGIVFSLSGGHDGYHGEVGIYTSENPYDLHSANSHRIYQGAGIYIKDDSSCYVKAGILDLNGARIFLDYKDINWGTDRNRVNSEMKVGEVRTCKPNPLYNQAADNQKTYGYGKAECWLTYDGSYEQAGKNLYLTNRDPSMPPLEKPVEVSKLKEKNAPTPPRTGDASRPWLWMALLVLSAAVFSTVRAARKRA